VCDSPIFEDTSIVILDDSVGASPIVAKAARALGAEAGRCSIHLRDVRNGESQLVRWEMVSKLTQHQQQVYLL